MLSVAENLGVLGSIAGLEITGRMKKTMPERPDKGSRLKPFTNHSMPSEDGWAPCCLLIPFGAEQPYVVSFCFGRPKVVVFPS